MPHLSFAATTHVPPDTSISAHPIILPPYYYFLVEIGKKIFEMTMRNISAHDVLFLRCSCRGCQTRPSSILYLRNYIDYILAVFHISAQKESGYL